MFIVLDLVLYYKKEFIYKIGSVSYYIYIMVFVAKDKDQDK